MKTKNREVEPTRRQAAVHTGMKALGFSESAPLVGILSSPHSSVSHTNQTAHMHRRSARVFVNVCVAVQMHLLYGYLDSMAIEYV